MISNVFMYQTLIAPRRNARFTTKHVEPLLILIVNRKTMDMVVLVLMDIVALVTTVRIVMEDLVQHLNTSVREPPKPNAIPLRVLFHPSIVKIEKRKFAKN